MTQGKGSEYERLAAGRLLIRDQISYCRLCPSTCMLDANGPVDLPHAYGYTCIALNEFRRIAAAIICERRISKINKEREKSKQRTGGEGYEADRVIYIIPITYEKRGGYKRIKAL